jgi:FkbM family methyltransferase
MTMSPEDYVRGLYRTTLGREADPAGLAAFVALIAETGDPTLVLEELLSSAEYALRSALPALNEALIPTCLAYLGGRSVTIIDVGAQMLGTEKHAYQPLCRQDIPHHITGFEPLAERVQEREESEEGGTLTLLPYAIGDGKTHTLYINNDDATSSIYPLHEHLTSQFEHLHTLRVERTLSVATRTLDEVLNDGPVDFLKLDIQGAELMALQGAERVLAQTAVIHCEVEFAEIYRGQCLFADVQVFLGARGFSLIDILVPHRYAYRNMDDVDGRDRLLWGDAVFFRETQDPSTLAAQSLIAALVYRKASLAQHLIERARKVS